MGSGIRRVGSGITAIGSGITDHGIGISSFLGIRDQAVQYLWDQGRKLVTLLESRIRNWRIKMGSAMKNIPRYHPARQLIILPTLCWMSQLDDQTLLLTQNENRLNKEAGSSNTIEPPFALSWID